MPGTNNTEHREPQYVLYTYASAIDDRDFARYARCFTDDVELVGFGGGALRGRDAWLAYVRTALEPYTATQHLLGPVQVDVADSVASTRCDVQATHFRADGSRFTLWATYLSTLTCADGHWRIERHELVVRGSSEDPA